LLDSLLQEIIIRMDLEDKTPQNEDRNPVAEIAFLTLGEADTGLDGCFLAESGNVGSVESSPLSEEASVVRENRSHTDAEQSMSQSYHEIFDTQAYIQSNLAAAAAATDQQDGDSDTEHKLDDNLTADEIIEDNTDETSQVTEDDVLSGVKSPDNSDDRASSGNTETGTPFIPQGDVYLEDGRLVSECDSQVSRDYLTNKLVADSLLWQQNFKPDLSPSPEEGCRLAPPHRNEVAIRHKETKPAEMMADPVLLATLEREARRLASDVDTVVENLACILQSISALTVETVETYRDGVCKTCDSVDDNIKGMYRLIARWEELNKSMSPCYKLSAQIKDIRKALDSFEGSLSGASSKT